VGVVDTADPLGGSYFVEALTDEIELRSKELIAKIDDLGGSVQAIDFMKNEIEESAFGYHERYRQKQDIVVGVNKFVEDTPQVPDILRVDPESEREQVERLRAFKAARDPQLAELRLEEVRECARGTGNLLPPAPQRGRAMSAAPAFTSVARPKTPASTPSIKMRRRTPVNATLGGPATFDARKLVRR